MQWIITIESGLSILIIIGVEKKGVKKGYRKIMLYGKLGLIDKNFNEVLEPKYDEICGIDEDGYRRIKLKDKYGLVDKDFNIILEPKYEGIWCPDKKGYRKIRLNDKWGLLDKNFNKIF